MEPSVLDLRSHATADPSRLAIVCGEERLSYGELEALANRLANVLRAFGLKRGDHLASLFGNRPHALALAWAAWRTGTYLTPLSTALAASEWHYLIADSDAKLVLVDDEYVEPLGDKLPEGVRLLTWSLVKVALRETSDQPDDDEPPGALMMYTSGTTGAPKGVHRALLPADWRGTPPFAADLVSLFNLGGTHVRYLSTAPLYHAAPLRCALTVTAGGGTVFVMDDFDAESALDLIERESITHSQWVPSMFQRLLALPESRRAAHRAPAHRVAIHGAAPCPVRVKWDMMAWWGTILLEYYSGSEGVGLTLITSHEWLEHPGSVGRARKGVLHVVDDAGVEVPPGTNGLICFSGVSPFTYYKAPEKTARRTLPQGWQTFGDIGHADEDGWLYLTDRLDDMIISGGVNIYPQEIEAALRQAPGVWDVAVVGIDDARFGERPVAFVVPDRSYSGGDDELRDTVNRQAAESLGRFKRPDSIHVLKSLPRSPTGKLLRKTLRQMIQATQESA